MLSQKSYKSILYLLLFTLTHLNLSSQNYIYRDSDLGIVAFDKKLKKSKILIPAPYRGLSLMNKDPNSNKIYFLDGYNFKSCIYSFEEGQEKPKLLFCNDEEFSDYVIDFIRNKIYLCEGTRIYVKDLDQSYSPATLLFNLNNINASTLQFDYLKNRLFILDKSKKSIHTFDINTKIISTVISSLNSISEIEFNPTSQSLYYVENIQTNSQINKLDLTTEKVKMVYNLSNRSIWDMEVSSDESEIYISSQFPVHIFEKYNTKTKTKTVLQQPEDYFSYLTLDNKNKQLYYSKYGLSDIFKYDLLKNTEEKILSPSSSSKDIVSFDIDRKNKRFVGINGESGLVVSDFFGNETTEIIPPGVENAKDLHYHLGHFYFYEENQIWKCDTSGNNLEKLPLSNLKNLIALTINREENNLIFATNGLKLYQCSLTGDNLKLIDLPAEITWITDIKYSSFSKRIYISQNDKNGIVSINTNGGGLTVEYKSITNTYLNEIALDDVNGRIFFYEYDKDRISVQSMNNKIASVYKTGLPYHNKSVYDPNCDCLYSLTVGNEILQIKFGQAIKKIVPNFISNYSGNSLDLMPGNKLVLGLYNGKQVVATIDKLTLNVEYLLYPNFHFVSAFDYDEESNCVWGVNFRTNKLFKADLNTKEVTYLQQAVSYSNDVIFDPKLNRLLQGADNRIIAYDLLKNKVDTLLILPVNTSIYDIHKVIGRNEIVFTENVTYKISTLNFDGSNYKTIFKHPSYQIERTIFSQTDSTLLLINGSKNEILLHDFNIDSTFNLGKKSTSSFLNNLDYFNDITDSLDYDMDGYYFSTDCDDNNFLINPSMIEIANNDIDENCDGIFDFTDFDGDGFNTHIDCNDNDSAFNPGQIDIPNNLFDENCDGYLYIIDEDGDGFNSSIDCNDLNENINPGIMEIPNNNIDDDCDGNIDNTTATEDILGDKKINLFPNPASNYIEIITIFKISRVEIYDIFGKYVATQTNNVFGLNGINPGQYIVKIIGVNGENYNKLLMKI